MPSYMLSIRLPPPMEKSFRAAAKRAGLTLSDWMKATCVEKVANEEETQRPLDPNGPEPVAVPIKQRKKREKVVEREKPSQIVAITVTDSPDAATTAYVIPQDDYTGATIKYHGITMYECGKGRWTKEPPPKK